MKENSRTKNSVFNASSNLITYIIKTILSFVARTIFIKTLGELYLGVNGLLTNILSMLSLAELGVSAAISYSLYKPLAENNKEQISALMSFYKKVYNIVGCVIAVGGCILYLFLDKLIPEYKDLPNISIIYFLYLINTVSTYFVAYKEILITADQKYYKLTKINVTFTVLLYILQIIGLLIFKNFIVYLLIQFTTQILQKVFTNRFITKNYSDIDYNSKTKIEPEAYNLIKKNVKATFFHKIGDYCINGTDNIIISSFINVVTVGLYSNYTTIITMVNTIITMVYNNLTASVGNLLVKDKEKSLGVFLKLDFLAFMLYGFSSVILLGAINPFIQIWIGEKYVMHYITTILICFNFFFSGTRLASYVVKTAAGLQYADKFVPIIQSAINLVVSIALVQFWGIDGVIIGTIASSILPCLYRPYVIYKNVFKSKLRPYMIKYYFKYIIVTIINIGIIAFINNYIKFSGILGIILAIVISITIFGVSIMLCFRRYDEFKYWKELIKNIMKKILMKLKILH